jgi:sugar lactone lactonase YvrE
MSPVLADPPNNEGWIPVAGFARGEDTGRLGNTHGSVAIDSKGLVYSNTDTERSIVVHRPDGSFVRAIAGEYPGIHGMVIRKEGDEEFIYAAHLAGKQALKLKLDGTPVWSIGLPVESGKYEDEPSAYNPTGIAVGPDGRIYVADGYGRQWIHIYAPDKTYLKSFGGPGKEPGRFRTCHGLAIDSRGETPVLLVCDRENRRIQRFSLDGEFIDVPVEGLRRPCAMGISGNEIAIAELEGRVTLLDENFELIGYVGSNSNKNQWARNGVPESDWIDGVFTSAHGCALDAEGNLYVSDWNANGRLSKMERLPEDSKTKSLKKD